MSKVQRTKKHCSGCGLAKSLTAFHRCRRNPDGYQYCCKPCCRLRRFLYWDKEQEARRARRAANPGKVKEDRKRHYDPHKQRLRNAKFRENNRELCAAATARWKENNREAVRNHNAQRQARLMKAEGKFTLVEWQQKCKKYGGRCAYCRRKRKLTRHHVVPLSVGGSNRIDNVVPACQSCNSSIGVKIVPPGG